MASPIINFIDRKVAVQEVVYCGNPRPDGYGGSNFDAPVPGKVRCQEKDQLVMDQKGEEVLSRTELLIGQIDAKITPGGYFFLGPLSDLPEGTTTPPPKAQRVITVSATPLFGSTTDFVRRAYL